jgi:hypothetical protein
LWRILVSTTDGKNVSIQPHDRDSEKNIKPAKDRLPEIQNLRQISILMMLFFWIQFCGRMDGGLLSGDGFLCGCSKEKVSELVG